MYLNIQQQRAFCPNHFNICILYLVKSPTLLYTASPESPDYKYDDI